MDSWILIDKKIPAYGFPCVFADKAACLYFILQYSLCLLSAGDIDSDSDDSDEIRCRAFQRLCNGERAGKKS